MRGAVAFVSALLMAGPALASPEGVWEIEMRDSRYRIELCGPQGDQLCATLIWLGNGAANAENLPYLDTMLIDHAPPIGPDRWKGDLHIYGQSGQGTITQVSPDQITLRGCAYVVVCKTYQLYRYSN